MSLGERAHLKTLTDAFAEAMKALEKIDVKEKIVNCHFGEFDESVGGGFYWSIDLVSRRELGNTKTALSPPRYNYREENARTIVMALQQSTLRAAGLIKDEEDE